METNHAARRPDAVGTFSRRRLLGSAAAGGLLAAVPGGLAMSPGRRDSDVRIREVAYRIRPEPMRTPLKFGGSVMRDLDILSVRITVERRGGGTATGLGVMPLGNVWSFPPRLETPQRSLEAMRKLAPLLQEVFRGSTESGHPVDLLRDLLEECLRTAASLSTEMNLAHAMPKLCTLVVYSAFDAALLDAFGIANRVNTYNALGEKWVGSDLATDLDDRFRGKYLDSFTLREPRQSMPLYHLVGGLDPLTPGDVKEAVNDGLPETLIDWIGADGLTHFKIKLDGDNLDWDVTRIANIERVVAAEQEKRGVAEWVYSADFNERCRDVEYLLAFFARVRESSPAAFRRLQYIEQPTDRDLKAHPENRVHAAAKIKPVVIDESLTDFESLLLAREQGYSGIALKACKGISEALKMAAAALEFGMFITVQDLTCPGASFLQSAELAARVPTVAAVEGNARQYLPAANRAWVQRYPGLFDIRDGTVATGVLSEPGLGHAHPD